LMNCAGEYFLAGACFSKEQDCRIGWCDSLDLSQYGSYACAASDNLVGLRKRETLGMWKLANQQLSLASVLTHFVVLVIQISQQAEPCSSMKGICRLFELYLGMVAPNE
jgi:hypothetical protein